VTPKAMRHLHGLMQGTLIAISSAGPRVQAILVRLLPKPHMIIFL
jgi:hypothetical protein